MMKSNTSKKIVVKLYYLALLVIALSTLSLIVLGDSCGDDGSDSSDDSGCGGDSGDDGGDQTDPDSSCDPNEGFSCGCGICGCGGTIQCDGSCSGTDPTISSYGQNCNCGICGCGGTIQCDGSCSGSNPTPSNYGQACGTCGRGTIQCDGSCSGDYSDCGSAGWYNTGSSCGNCGAEQRYCNGCDFTGSYQCINQGPCGPGQKSCSGDTTLVCNSICQWQNEQNCNTFDGFNGGGNTQTVLCGNIDNDAPSEFRDFGCSAGSCTYTITQTKDCDNLDGWYGGGNTPGCGSDANSVWHDYFVITNTNSCTSTTTCTGSGSVNCDSSDICNNRCEGNVFVSVPPMKDFFVVTNSNSCTSTIDSPVKEDCATKSSADSDGSPTAYIVPGIVTDYSTCTLDGCTGTSYSDSCSGNILAEYGAVGSSFTLSNYNCENLESTYCSNDRFFNNEWLCSASFGACTDAPDTHIGTNFDGDAKDKECGDSLCDNAPGVYDATKTQKETNCADGLDNDCDGIKDCQDNDCAGKIGANNVLCCQSVLDCIQDDCVIENCLENICTYSNRAQCDATECDGDKYCDNLDGNCKSPDESQNICLNCVNDQTSGRWDWELSIFEDAGKAFSTNSDVFTTLFNSDNSACSQLSGGGCYDTQNNPINHKPAIATGLCCGDDLNEYYKPDYYGGECANDINDCIWSTGDAQQSDTGNAKWWCHMNVWSECSLPSHIGKKHGNAICAGYEEGGILIGAWTGHPAPENTYGNNGCADNYDNDGDTLKDCQDIDCAGRIFGQVSEKNKGNIEMATVGVLDGTNLKQTDLTDNNGNFEINILCGAYNVIASSDGYLSQAYSNVFLPPNDNVQLNFELTLGSTCEADCTYLEDSTIHGECSNRNGCSFIDDIAKNSCDLAQIGWIRDYDQNNLIQCVCKGECGQSQIGPLVAKTNVKAKVQCDKENLIKVVRVVNYKGKPVNLVVTACS